MKLLALISFSFALLSATTDRTCVASFRSDGRAGRRKEDGLVHAATTALSTLPGRFVASTEHKTSRLLARVHQQREKHVAQALSLMGDSRHRDSSGRVLSRNL